MEIEEDNFQYNHNNRENKGLIFEQTDVDIRLGFIRKVYGILSAQLSLTAIMCALPLMSTSARALILGSPGLSIFFFAVAISTMLALVCCKSNARSVPTNYILLLAFTIAEGWSVAQCVAIVDDT
jgi:FtsH-binding integral membrane protein